LEPLHARSYPEVVEPVYVSPAVEAGPDFEQEPGVEQEPEVVASPAYAAVEPDSRHSFEDESDPFAARADYRDDVFAAPSVEQPRKQSAQDEDFSSYFEDATVDLPTAGQAANSVADETGRPSVK